MCVAFFRHANARAVVRRCTHLSVAIAVASLMEQLHLGARASSVSSSSHALSNLRTLKIAPAPTTEHSIDAHRKQESACASQRAQHCFSVSLNLESAQRCRAGTKTFVIPWNNSMKVHFHGMVIAFSPGVLLLVSHLH